MTRTGGNQREKTACEQEFRGVKSVVIQTEQKSWEKRLGNALKKKAKDIGGKSKEEMAGGQGRPITIYFIQTLKISQEKR